MGTRCLVAVQLDGDYRVAQFVGCDGYPEGQGLTVLTFLRNCDRAVFERKLRAVNLSTHPNALDDASNVLAAVQDCPEGIRLTDSRTFPNHSLFCEWAYVVDLDADCLEVYKGWNRYPTSPYDRFHGPPDEDGYYPCVLMASWPLSQLPSDVVFLKESDPERWNVNDSGAFGHAASGQD